MKKLFLIAAAAMMVACGNKQQSQQAESDSIAVENDAAEQVASQADQQAAIDAKATERIMEFYQDYVFGGKEATDAVINKYCTKKLAKKLADDYEYDGGGYAIWDFRSDSQDPDETKVLRVEPMGEGKYKVVMDANVTCIVSVVSSGEDLLFDDVDND